MELLLVFFGCMSLFFMIAYLRAKLEVGKILTAFTVYETSVQAVLKSIQDVHKNGEKLGSIKERFKQFTALSDQQQQLASHVYAPSASASHSKHKNSIITQIKSIEEEKRAILKTILDDGFDATILMIDGDGNKTKKKISEILADNPTGSTDVGKTDPKTPRNNVSKLRLVTNEENDKDVEPHDPEIH
jgi:hypothetical protein